MGSDKSARPSKRSGLKPKTPKDTNATDIDKNEKINILVEGKENAGDDKKKKKQSKRRRAEEDTGTRSAKEDGAETHKRKKKRVSFSADTKAREHDSDSDSDTVEKKTSSEVPVEEQAGDEAETDKREEKKKKKKEKRKSKAGAESTTPETYESPLISYLSLYHKHRGAWKFQKNRETHLFKHILSLEQVPVLYNAALLCYLQGLKSEGAKQRLREVAEATVKTDVEETQFGEIAEGVEDQLVDYRKGITVFRTNLSEGNLDADLGEYLAKMGGELTKRFEKRQRAEVILFAVDGNLYTYVKPKAQKGKKPAPDQPAKKKKKNRTAFIEISSSSESDGSSDSDSDSSSDKGNKKKAQNKNKSSSSSSSDTNSDSDSDNSS